MLSDDALNRLFLQACSHNGWRDKPVTDEQLAIRKVCLAVCQHYRSHRRMILSEDH